VIDGSDARAELITELAILIHYVGRKLSLHMPEHPDIVPLSALEGIFLEHISRHPGIRPSELSADLGVKSSNTSTVLRAMEDKGMVRRTVDAGDARGVQVFLTARAEAAIARIHEDWVRILAGLIREDDGLRAATRLLAAIDDGWPGQSTSPR
jgi:DNA-binding MarR family transcriptional regulator